MLFRRFVWLAAVAVAVNSTSIASAQLFGNGCSACSAPPARPAITSCAPVQPVYSSCYQTVPVTTYRKEKQTVKVPYYKTAYENRDVTVMEPVTRSRTVEVPFVSYKTVYDSRTIHRDMGRWKTNYHPVAKCAPCQVDPRPGLMGWLNRTGYSFRSQFVPNYRTSRQYVPNMVACNVQVPRQVAVRGTRKVVQNYTQMVARKTTERVEVRKLAWREEEMTVNRPVTAYRTVPIGSTLAYGYGGYGGNTLAYGGYGYPGSAIAYIDEEDSTRTARRPEPDSAFDSDRDRTRSAERTFPEDGTTRSGSRSFGRDTGDGAFQRSSSSRALPPAGSQNLKQPPFPANEPSFDDFAPQTRRQSDSQYRLAAHRRSSAPSAFVGGWKARHQDDMNPHQLTIPAISVTDRN